MPALEPQAPQSATGDALPPGKKTRHTFEIKPMKQPKWKSRAGAVVIALGMLLVLNPEVRALLLLADAVGLEVLVLMALTQARNFWPVLAGGTRHFSNSLCTPILGSAKSALRFVIGMLWSRQFISQPAQATYIFLGCVHCPRQQPTTP